MESKEMERAVGTWHRLYLGLVLVFLLGFLMFAGSVSTAAKTEKEAFGIIALVALIFLVATVVFWILAAANATAIRRYCQAQMDKFQRDHEVEMEGREQLEKVSREKVVVQLYELASEFLSRFSDHYIQMAAEHSEKKWNRRSFWLVIVYITSIANQIEALGDTHRARGIRNLLERELTAQVGLDGGSGWAELKNAALLVVVAGKMSVKSAPIEYLEVARSTRLVEYVIDFTPAGS